MRRLNILLRTMFNSQGFKQGKKEINAKVVTLVQRNAKNNRIGGRMHSNNNIT